MSQLLVHLLFALPLVGAFGMFALGIVVIYRASGVLNLAHGGMAMMPAYICYSLWRAGLPIGVAFVIGSLAGGAIGYIVERVVLRRLRAESATVQTVGTVAVFGLLVAIAAKIWGTAPLRAPSVFPEFSFDVGRTSLHGSEIGLFASALLFAGLFFVLLQRTSLGLSMRGAADNRRASALCGIDPDKMTSLAWVLGGVLAGAGGVMLAAATNLHPYTLSLQVLPAFVAVLLGGLGSLRGAVVGAAIVGLVQGVVPGLGPLGKQTGAAQLVLAVAAFVTMAVRGGARLQAGDVRGGLATETPAPTSGRAPRWRIPLIAFLIVLPWIPLPGTWGDTVRADVSLAAIYTVVSVSLVILTGWVGQISLAHAAFLGVSAFTTGIVVRSLGVPFPLNVAIAAAVAALAAVLLGIVALRIRGLYLAVATLIFGWMADGWLFRQSAFVGEEGSSSIPNRAIGQEGGFPYFDFTDRRAFYYVAVAAAVLAIAAAANLRDSRTGRAFFAVRGSEVAAASVGIDVTRTKLLAFAISGALAGLAGNLTMLDQLTATPGQFDLTASLFFLSMAVVGGVTRLGGAVAGSIVFALLTEIFFRVRALDGYLPLVSPALLLAILLLYRGGLAGGIQTFVRRFLPQRAAVSDEPPAPPAEVSMERLARPAPTPGARALSVEDIGVRFGGLAAIDDVSLHVDEGEIVGLIGPNGAGKTTLFNAVSGLVTVSSGHVSLFEQDVTALPVHERARLGLGRTFQIVQLFGSLTVADNLLVATHLQGTAGPLGHLIVSSRSLDDERQARARVRETLALAGLTDVAHRRAGDLPFGILRQVEVARAVLTGARLIMLDEPASGLDDNETTKLAELLRRLRADLGLSLLVIEHDVAFVSGLSDRMYVLERGRLLASGTPADVRANPAVIAAYLGGTRELVTT